MKKRSTLSMLIFLSSLMIIISVNVKPNKLYLRKVSEEECSTGCINCGSKDVCIKCADAYTLYNGKCFDNEKLNSFIKDLASDMGDKQKEILQFLINKNSDLKSNKSTYINIDQGISHF